MTGDARRRAMACLAGLAALVAAGPAGATPAPADVQAAQRGASYLAGLQAPNGSIPEGARADYVADAVVALVAGDAPRSHVDAGLGYLADHALTPPDDEPVAPYTGRIVSAVVAAGGDPRNFAGADLVARIEAQHNPVTGSYGGDNLYADALAMLGLLAAEADLPNAALNYLRVGECDDGGWSHQAGCLNNTPETDATAVAVAVLAAAQGTDAAEVRNGRQWLLDARNASGCWGHGANATTNANSCGLAIVAIHSLGEDAGAAPWTTDAFDPIGELRSLQAESGGIKWMATNANPDPYATSQAVPALAGWAAPVSPPASPPPPGPTTSTSVPDDGTEPDDEEPDGKRSERPGAAATSDATADPDWFAGQLTQAGGQHTGRRNTTTTRPEATAEAVSPGTPVRSQSADGESTAAGGNPPTLTAHLPGGGGVPVAAGAAGAAALAGAAGPLAWIGRRRWRTDPA